MPLKSMVSCKRFVNLPGGSCAHRSSGWEKSQVGRGRVDGDLFGSARSAGRDRRVRLLARLQYPIHRSAGGKDAHAARLGGRGDCGGGGELCLDGRAAPTAPCEQSNRAAYRGRTGTSLGGAGCAHGPFQPHGAIRAPACSHWRRAARRSNGGGSGGRPRRLQRHQPVARPCRR